jgi:hypothetical protein
MRSTLKLYEAISRIQSILEMTDKEMCSKNKCLTINMVLDKMNLDLNCIERKLLSEEKTFLESEIKECEQNISALNLRFTISLN